MSLPPDTPGRFHVALTVDGRKVAEGWWGSEAVARGKLAGWVGQYGHLPDARVALVDGETGAVLTDWPGEE